MAKQYKAYDFKSGRTYLIGAFDSKASAMAYCQTCGYEVIAQTVVALTEEEFEHALKNSEERQMDERNQKAKMFTVDDLVKYLQSQMDDYKKHEIRYGADDRIVEKKADAMIACKEMVEALIQEPVNLRFDGKVTIGF